jgi:DNA-binding GntR family transcriptional regulator
MTVHAVEGGGRSGAGYQAGEVVEPAAPYSEQVAAIVRAAILAGRYELGERLPEVELSTRLGISRSPIREGLRKLADEGLVVLHPRRGAYVTKFGEDEVRELLEYREALDVMAARLAAHRATTEQLDAMKVSLEALTVAHKGVDGAAPPWLSDFHVLILRAAGNRKICERGVEVHTKLHLARFRSGSTSDRAQAAHDEHQLILDAIRSGDPTAAEHAMRLHLQHAADRILRVAGGGAIPTAQP